MSARFLVRRASKVAGIFALEGTLEAGELRNGMTVNAETAAGRFPVVVQTVAFVSPPRKDRNDLTITIAQPPFPLEALNGALLTTD